MDLFNWLESRRKEREIYLEEKRRYFEELDKQYPTHTESPLISNNCSKTESFDNEPNIESDTSFESEF